MNNFFSRIAIKNLKASLVTIRFTARWFKPAEAGAFQKKYGYVKEDIYDLWINKNEPEKAELDEQRSIGPLMRKDQSYFAEHQPR